MARLGAYERQIFLDIKAACYRGLGTNSLFHILNDQLGPALSADATCCVLLDPDTALPIYSISCNWEDWQHEPLIKHALLRTPAADPGAWISENRRTVNAEEYAIDGDIHRDPYFLWHVFLGGYRHELLLPCTSGGHGRMLFTINRREAAGNFEARQVRLLDALAPHLAAAVNAATVREALAQAGRPEYGCIVLDEHGGVLMTNAAGENWVNAAAAKSERGHLWAISILHTMLQRALAEDGDTVMPVLVVPHPVSGIVSRLRAERTLGRNGEPNTMILIEPVRAVENPDVLKRLGLTSRETSVALAVVRGEDLSRHAWREGVSPYTVNEYLRSVYTKLAVSSRAELAARLLAWN